MGGKKDSLLRDTHRTRMLSHFFILLPHAPAFAYCLPQGPVHHTAPVEQERLDLCQVHLAVGERRVIGIRGHDLADEPVVGLELIGVMEPALHGERAIFDKRRGL